MVCSFGMKLVKCTLGHTNPKEHFDSLETIHPNILFGWQNVLYLSGKIIIHINTAQGQCLRTCFKQVVFVTFSTNLRLLCLSPH
jgi:hypothetical protein